MEQKHERNSSLELLRIICIFLIIGHHYCSHGGYAPFTAETLSPGAVFVQSLGAVREAVLLHFYIDLRVLHGGTKGG